MRLWGPHLVCFFLIVTKPKKQFRYSTLYFLKNETCEVKSYLLFMVERAIELRSGWNAPGELARTVSVTSINHHKAVIVTASSIQARPNDHQHPLCSL